MSDAEQLQRFRALAQAHLPPDVYAWAIERIAPQLPRNEALRTAANLIGGTRWAKARALSEAIKTLRQEPGRMEFLFSGGHPAHHVQRALRLDPLTPSGIRQLLRILED